MAVSTWSFTVHNVPGYRSWSCWGDAVWELAQSQVRLIHWCAWLEVLRRWWARPLSSTVHRLNRNVSLAHSVVLIEQMSTPSGLECFSSDVLNLFPLQNRSVLTAKQDSHQSCWLGWSTRFYYLLWNHPEGLWILPDRWKCMHCCVLNVMAMECIDCYGLTWWEK